MRAISLVGAVFALAVMPSAAAGGVPGQALGELQRTVGDAVSRAVELPKQPLPPAKPAPAPAPRPSAPAPASRAAKPAPAATSQAPPRPVRQTGRVRASSSGASDSPGNAAREPSSPATAKSAATRQADPTDAAVATSPPVLATAADVGGEDDGSLPFTGFALLPLTLVAALALLAGIGLRRAVRVK